MTDPDSGGVVEQLTASVNRPMPRFLVRLLPRVGEPLVKLLDELENRRVDRAQEWLSELCRLTGMEMEDLVTRALQNEELTEAVASAFLAAATSPSADKRELLARALAPALHDDAKIDSAAFVVQIIATLQPVHVRVLNVLAQDRTEPYDESEAKQSIIVADAWPQALVARGLRSEETVVEMVLLHLQAQGLVFSEGFAFSDGSRPWRITSAGREVLAELALDE